MGIVFGKIDVEQPPYIVCHKASTYEIRKYESSVACKVYSTDFGVTGEKFSNEGFRALARLVGGHQKQGQHIKI